METEIDLSFIIYFFVFFMILYLLKFLVAAFFSIKYLIKKQGRAKTLEKALFQIMIILGMLFMFNLDGKLWWFYFISFFIVAFFYSFVSFKSREK